MRRKDVPGGEVNGVERDILEALERLKANRPRVAALARQAKLNRLRISISTVALEAGRSRTLIGHEGCNYPKARAAVLAAMEPVVEHRTAVDTILSLRDEVANLKRALKLRDSVNAALVLRVHAVERAAKEKVGRAARVAERNTQRRDSNTVAGRSLIESLSTDPGGTIVPFRRDDANET